MWFIWDLGPIYVLLNNQKDVVFRKKKFLVIFWFIGSLLVYFASCLFEEILLFFAGLNWKAQSTAPHYQERKLLCQFFAQVKTYTASLLS